MATKNYGINDKWTNDDIENVIEVTSEDGSVNSVKVNGEEYGGGGGGCTATVTFTNSSNSKEFGINMPLIDPETGIARADGILLHAGETLTVTVPLGPGGCVAQIGSKGDWPESNTATGGVRYDEGTIIITGNGTLTIA